MKINQWTRALLATGVVGIGAVAQAEEAPSSNLLTAVSGTQISGYVSTSAAWAPNKMAPPGGVSFMQPTDGFNLDNVDITISKPLDEGEWSAGYTVELWTGPAANQLGNNIRGGSLAGNDLAVKQANVKLNAPIGNGLVLTMGVFDAIIGYEVANVGDNPNYTRNYAYSYEPFQHTGVLASYQLCESVSASVGMANEQATQLNSRGGGYTYMAAMTVTAPEALGPLAGASITAGVVDGSAAAGSVVASRGEQMIYVGGSIPTPIENLSLGFAWDHFNIDGAKDNDAIAGYVGYKVSEKMTLNTRLEYMDQGAPGLIGNGASATFNPAATAAANAAAAAAANATGQYLGTTVTLGYALWENVLTRAEWRYDKDLNGDKFLGTGNSLPRPGARNNNHLFALNVVYQF
jgi:hypothetical protein